ncbi:MAG TPA: hypothetical protein VNY36_07380 [Bacteroidia bacterium]|jgi:hypothetical protein|nr:hypothetical protein [Bacteroidia bacterium]
MKYLLLTFMLLLCIYGCVPECGYDTSPYLTADELSWLSYSNNQKVVFQNETGLIDTFTAVRSLEVLPPYHSQGSSPCDGGYQTGQITLGKTLSINVSHYYQFYPNNRNSASINESNFSNAAIENNDTINGKIYNNVYVLSVDTTYQHSGGVYKVHYTKANGVLKYYTNGSHVWVLK